LQKLLNEKLSPVFGRELFELPDEVVQCN
jgi:hypothetical protein